MTIQRFGRVDGKSNYKANPFGDDNQKRKKDHNCNINCRSRWLWLVGETS